MIRKATQDDLPLLMPLFDKAREYMRRCGNSRQWVGGYPSEEIIRNDIADGNFYVEVSDGEISGAFAFIIGIEPTYGSIEGEWLNPLPYGTIHRLASSGLRRGVADRCFTFCRQLIPNLRADTHEDNYPMQAALERNGFHLCGTIHLADGSPRLAYQSPP